LAWFRLTSQAGVRRAALVSFGARARRLPLFPAQAAVAWVQGLLPCRRGAWQLAPILMVQQGGACFKVAETCRAFAAAGRLLRNAKRTS